LPPISVLGIWSPSKNNQNKQSSQKDEHEDSTGDNSNSSGIGNNT
jgi:hypothetical protein